MKAWAAATVLLVLPLHGGVAREVGKVVQVRNRVLGTPPGGDPAQMSVGEAVILNLLVETGVDSGTRMTFDPHGALRLGPETQLRIDQATVDQATGQSASKLSLLLGRIRLSLSRLFRGDVEVETPSASLGIKGTDLAALVDLRDRTLAACWEGLVEVTSKAGGSVLLTAGTFTIVEPGKPPTPPAPFGAEAGTLSASAGGPSFTVPGEEIFTDPPALDEIDPQSDLPREGRSND